MKKNKMMRVASVLLVAVLLTTSVISGTFAKYVTSGETGDSARVAKFGVTITGSGDLFAKNYYSVNSGLSNQPAADGTEDTSDVVLTVESSNTDKVVAPGTKSNETNPFKLTVTGSPEVDVKVTLSIKDGFQDVVLKAGTYQDRTTQALEDEYTLENDYYPIVYTVTNNHTGEVITSASSLAALQTQLAEWGGLYLDAGALTNVSFTLSWEWAFGDSNHNQADTILGDLAAGTYTYATAAYNLTPSVTLVATVSQVD